MYNATWLVKAGKSYLVIGGNAYPSSTEKMYQQKVRNKDIEAFIENLINNEDVTTINFQMYPFKTNQLRYVRIGNQFDSKWKDRLNRLKC